MNSIERRVRQLEEIMRVGADIVIPVVLVPILSDAEDAAYEKWLADHPPEPDNFPTRHGRVILELLPEMSGKEFLKSQCSIELV